MPQIGWFEILIVVVLAILIIGPKDFPIMIRKIGQWMGLLKKYFSEFKKEVIDIENTVDEEISIDKNILSTTDDDKDE